MATINLYASKINQMSSLLLDVKKSVSDYKSELSSLKNKTLQINTSVCNTDDVISSIQASTQIQDKKIESLDSLLKNSEQFIVDVVQTDSNVADVITKRKNDFYKDYSYLKPDCEKNFWEKAKDFVDSVVELCKEHWKALATLLLIAIAVVVISTGIGGVFAPALVMMAKGILVGTAIGGTVGGIVSALMGGSFLEGFENGAFSGAISGALTGGVTSWLSSGGTVALSLGKIMLIGGFSEATASVLGDLGDIVIKGEDISFGEILFNASFSFTVGSIFSFVGFRLGQRLPGLKIQGITEGNGSWAHVWATQSARALTYGTKMSTKTILKGIGATIVGEVFEYLIEPVKGAVDGIKDLWKNTWSLE